MPKVLLSIYIESKLQKSPRATLLLAAVLQGLRASELEPNGSILITVFDQTHQLPDQTLSSGYAIPKSPVPGPHACF